MESFASVEKDHMGIGTHERYLKIASALAEKYNVSQTALSGHLAAGSCGCGHRK